MCVTQAGLNVCPVLDYITSQTTATKTKDKTQTRTRTVNEASAEWPGNRRMVAVPTDMVLLSCPAFAIELYVRALETKGTLRLDHLDPLWLLRQQHEGKEAVGCPGHDSRVLV